MIGGWPDASCWLANTIFSLTHVAPQSILSLAQVPLLEKYNILP
jgi:hypothetical protein